ncbi:MAG: hypothetical protein WCG03_01055, partial [Kiritimatiellales bacterium]
MTLCLKKFFFGILRTPARRLRTLPLLFNPIFGLNAFGKAAIRGAFIAALHGATHKFPFRGGTRSRFTLRTEESQAATFPETETGGVRSKQSNFKEQDPSTGGLLL